MQFMLSVDVHEVRNNHSPTSILPKTGIIREINDILSIEDIHLS